MGWSLLISNGVDIATVSKNMGHAKKSTTLDIYTGAIKSKNRVAADTLETTLLAKNDGSRVHNV
jgi:site-specific recombinase XerD